MKTSQRTGSAKTTSGTARMLPAQWAKPSQMKRLMAFLPARKPAWKQGPCRLQSLTLLMQTLQSKQLAPFAGSVHLWQANMLACSTHGPVGCTPDTRQHLLADDIHCFWTPCFLSSAAAIALQDHAFGQSKYFCQNCNSLRHLRVSSVMLLFHNLLHLGEQILRASPVDAEIHSRKVASRLPTGAGPPATRPRR